MSLQQNHFWLFCFALQTAVSVPSNVSQGEGAAIIISIVIASLFSSSKACLASRVSMNTVLCGEDMSWSVSESGKGREEVCVRGCRGNPISTIRAVLEERDWCEHNSES